MYRYGLGRRLLGLVLTAIVAAVAWFTVGQGTLDKINESNERSGGGGPQEKRIVNERRFAPVVAKFRRAVGSEAQLVSVVLRPGSVEFVAFERGTARGYRWREGKDKLQTFEVGGSGQAGQASTAPFPMSRLDTGAPQRIAAAISAAERGDFHLSIGDLTRADSGKVVWVLRGTIGERGVAYSAPPDGRRVTPYNPASPELSGSARLVQCIHRAQGDPAKLQSCVKRFAPH